MTTSTLEYIERLPKTTDGTAAPLMVLLHGYGSNEMDLFSFANELPDSLHIVSLQAPQNIGGNSFAWYSIDFDADQNKFSNLEEAKESVAKIDAFISDFSKGKNINPDKIFLLGFSQGAILSYALSLSSDKIKHVIALSGYLNEELLPKDATNTKTDYFISH